MDNSEPIWRLVDAKKDSFEALSDRIWGTPELQYAEHRSVAEHIKELEREGFRITRNLADIPTAVMGEAGEGGPVIALLGEFDALPGLSQEAGVAEPRPVEPNGNGHGCGHNLLGSAALLAASALKDWLADKGIAGRVRYYGCPAEEGGAAKTFMVRAGAFDDVDIAITWHPSAFCDVVDAVSLANTRIDFRFTGRASHAASAPHLGRSALDAVELMNVGVNYMREHMPSDARIHYAILDSGGIAPNVVQANAKVRYLVRARELPELRALIERVKKVAEGAALMTETSVEMKVISAVSNLLGNTPLEQAMQECFERLGPPPFDDIDRAFARRIQATLTDGGHRHRLPPGRRAAGRRRAVRADRAARLQACPDGRLDRCRRCQLGGAHRAGALRDLRDRHARTFLAADRPGQDAGRQEGHGPCRQGDGGHRGAGDRGQDADRARQGRPGGTDERAPLYLPDPRRREAAPRHGGGMSRKVHPRAGPRWRGRRGSSRSDARGDGSISRSP